MAPIFRDIPRTIFEQALDARQDLQYAQKTLTVDGHKIFTQTWTAVNAQAGDNGTPLTHLIFVHGLFDYGGRFAKYAHYYLNQGYTVTTFDFYGHGRSEGLHGWVPSIAPAYVTQLEHVIADVRQHAAAGTRVLLLAASMGALVTLHTLLKHVLGAPICDGVLLFCPFFDISVDSKPGSHLVWTAKVLGSLWPTAAISPSTHRGKNHDNPAVEQAFLDDVGTYSGWMRAGTGASLLQGVESLWKQLESLPAGSSMPPLIVFHGSHDKVADVTSAERAVKLYPQADKTFVRVENGFHVLWIGQEQIFDQSIAWIEERSQTAAVE